MLRLTTDKRPRWLVLRHGVKVEAKPLSTGTQEAAIAEARRRAAVLMVEADAAAEAGQPMDPLGANGANAAWLEGQRQQFYAEALGRYAITRWEGLADEAGEPLPVTPSSIEAFAAHADLAFDFVTQMTRSLGETVQEGNGSAASSGGSLPAEKTAVSDAPAPLDTPASPTDAAPVSDAEPAPAN